MRSEELYRNGLCPLFLGAYSTSGVFALYGCYSSEEELRWTWYSLAAD